MSECGIANFGGTFEISTTAQNTDLDLSGFEGLSYTSVPGLVNHPAMGVIQNVLQDPAWDDLVVCQSKGQANGGSGDLEFRYQESAGMTAMLVAAAPANTNNYACRVTWPNGSILYWRGLIAGWQFTLGGPEDLKHITFTAANNQVPVHVEAPTP